MVFKYEQQQVENLQEGITRRILAHAGKLMVVELHFKAGAVGYLHSHPHEQATYILEGVFEFEIGGVKTVVRKGDTLYKEPNIVHGATCLEDGKLIDIFTPQREDFLKK